MSSGPIIPPPLYNEPLPVAPIEYSIPVAVRPGAITAVGVISIILGSLGIVASLVGAMTGLGMMMALAFATAVASSSTSVSTPVAVSAAAAGAEDPNPQALGDDKRQVVIDALQAIRPFPDLRRRQLDALLSEHGKDIFDQPEESLDAPGVKAEVSDSGRLQTASGVGNGPDFFVLGNGRLELADDHAVFFPSDGRAAVRSSAPDEAASQDSSAVGSSLSDAQVRAVLRRIAHMGARLNSQQQQALTQILQSPTQQMISPIGGGVEASSQIKMAMSLPDGSAIIQSGYAGSFSSLTLDSSGQTTTSSTTRNGPRVRMATKKVNLRWVGVALIATAINLGLAIFLLVSGILVLRQSRRGATLHWIYAALKIPMVILAAVAASEVGFLFFSTLPSASPARASFQAGIIMAVPALLGLIYPVALLFVLRSKTVRGYYAAG